MRRWTWFNTCATGFLIALTGCDWCEKTPLKPDKCFSSTFNYGSYEYGPSNDSSECGDQDYEPNEDVTQAVAPATHECNGTRTAHVDGPDDVDVFRTGGCEGSIFTSLPSPVVSSANVTEGDVNLRFCIFPMCEDGATNLQACTGNGDTRKDDTGAEVKVVWDARLDSGFIGCCRVGPGTLDAAYFCPGRARKVDTYFWIDAGELPLANTCSKYSFTFSVNAD